MMKRFQKAAGKAKKNNNTKLHSQKAERKISVTGVTEMGQSILLSAVGKGMPLIIAFSSLNSNGYSFYRTLDPLNINKLFIRDPGDNWYQDGIGEGLNSIDDIVDFITDVIATLEPSCVATFGTSMGGYASILFGNLIKADHVIASSPQTIIDSRLPHSPRLDHSEKPWFDLADFLASDRASSQHHIFYGCADIVDIYNVARVDWRKANLYPVADQDHLLATLLTSSGDFLACINAALAGIPYVPTVPIDARGEDTLVTGLVRRLVEAMYLEAPYNPLGLARALREMEPNWAAPQYVLARLSEKAGDLELASRHAGRASKLSRNSVTFASYYSDLLFKLGQDELAEVSLRRVLKLHRKHYQSMVILSQVLARLGRRDEALQMIDQAILVRPRVQRAFLVRDKIAAGQSLAPVPVDADANDMEG